MERPLLAAAAAAAAAMSCNWLSTPTYKKF